MDNDDVWRHVATERHRLAALLDSLDDPAEWDKASLCAGWRVRDVVAHLTLATEVRLPGLLVDAVRARGSFNRLVHDTAVRKAATVSARQLVHELRDRAESHRRPPGTRPLDPLTDVLVHSQDVAVPLGRDHPMPPKAARAAAERVWATGFPHSAQRRLRGLRLIATDTEWTAGPTTGNAVEGPTDALLLVLTGRPVALPRLRGGGVAELAERMSVPT